MAELVRLLHTLTTEGLTWKQQSLVLLLTEAGDVAESELFRWLEHPGRRSAKDVLKQLHRDRQIE
jgi:hypothetical protein